MARIARTPAEVIASEISYRSPETSWADALAIASVVSNRALALGVTPQQVVGTTQEFNAYGSAMPAGAKIDLAQRAIDDVAKFGPTTAATFYAMPRAIDNLPPTKEFDMAVDGGHMYFTEPTGGAIKTSVGYRAPVDIATVNAAAAQRKTYEMALVDEDNAGMPTPGMRPGTLNISQNPALLAGMPLSQVDPNISTGVPALTALMGLPENAVAQQFQSAAAPVASQQDLAAAASRFGEDPQAIISSPADLRAALSRMNTPASNPFDITQAMNDAIAQSVSASPPSFDDSRMADNAPLSEADKALQEAMKSSAANAVTDRFGTPAGPVTRTVQTTSIPGEVQPGSYQPGSMPVMDVSGVPANRVQSVAVQPGSTINSPQALAAALGSFPAAMSAQREVAAPAMATAEAVKGGRIGTTDTAAVDPGRFAGAIDTSAMDQSRFSPDSIQTADAALKDAISQATAPSAQPADIGGFAEAITAQRGPTSGVNSAEMQAMQGSIERQMQEQAVAQAASAAANSNLAEGMQAQREVAPNQVAQSNLAEGMLAAREVAATPATTMTPQQIAGYQEAAKTMAQAGMLNIGQQPPTDLSGNLPTGFDVLGTAAGTPVAPALETVEVAPQPTVAAVDDVAPVQISPAVTTSVPSVTKSMPAVQTRQASAMDVWGGKAQTGVATDGSTVSRVSGNRIGRYVPSFDYTVFSQDDGATWSNPIAGNKLTASAAPAVAPSVQPASSQSLISRLMSVLTGTVPGASPTDVGPSMGLDGGMSLGRDGPAGAPSGWGPGGSITSPGSAGGYGNTNGIDPNGTR